MQVLCLLFLDEFPRVKIDSLRFYCATGAAELMNFVSKYFNTEMFLFSLQLVLLFTRFFGLLFRMAPA